MTRNPSAKYHYCIGPSDLHRIGIFASKDMIPGEKISVFLWRDKSDRSVFIRDESCRFCNHSFKPNAMIVKSGSDYDLVSIRKLKDREEIFIDYLKSVNTLLKEGLFTLPSKVRCRTFNFIPYIKGDGKRSLLDELREITNGEWL